MISFQEYEREAEGLLSDDPKRWKLVAAVEEAQKIVQAKMDLFTRLQQFYETLQAIKEENNQWVAITSQQVSPLVFFFSFFIWFPIVDFAQSPFNYLVYMEIPSVLRFSNKILLIG